MSIAKSAVVRPITNQEIGDLIGCTHSMASRLRAGKRLPGIGTLENIQREFGIPWVRLLAARNSGQTEFGRMFREAIADRTSKAA